MKAREVKIMQTDEKVAKMMETGHIIRGYVVLSVI